MKKYLTHLLILTGLIGTTVMAQTIPGTPFLSRVSSGDTSPNYLFSKLVAGTGITLTKNNPGANETITIDGSGFATGTNMWGGSLASDIYNLNSNNVGIGTTTPAFTLDVNGTARFGNNTTGVDIGTGAIRLTGSGARNIYTSGYSSQLQLDGSTIALNTNSGGNVGIGTTSPSQMLTVGTNNQFTVASTGAVSALSYNINNTSASVSNGLFAPAGNTVALSTSGSERFRVDSTGNVGIGTTTPGAKLDVVGINGQMAARISNFSGLTYSTTAVTGNGRPVLELVNRDAAGYRGGLHVYTSGNNDGTYLSSTAATVGSWTAGAYAGGSETTGTFVVVDSAASGIVQNAGNIQFYGATGLTAPSTTAIPERMRITSAGNVGIGTTTPNFQLAVSGSDATVAIDNNGGSASFLRMFNNGTQRFVIDARSTATALSSPTSPMIFNTASTERMRIDNAGNVGIGTSTPVSKLQVVGGDIALDTNRYLFAPGSGTLNIGDSSDNINIANGSIYATPNGGNVGIGSTTPAFTLTVNGTTKIYTGTAGVDFGGAAMRFTGGTGTIYTGGYSQPITVDGSSISLNGLSGNYVGIGTTSPITTLDVNGTITQATVKSCSLGLTTDASGSITGCVVSDKSVKKNIKPLTKSIDTLMKLKAVTYKWKDTTKDNQVHSGFIAQEVAKVLPEAVVSAGEKLKGVDPNAVIALVVKSVQDLVIRVAGLEERLDEQQEEIDELRALLIKNNIK